MTRARHRWTTDEDQALAYLWDNKHLNAIARRLGRTPSAVHARATLLGLCKRPCWATLQEVADASGFDRERVQRILRWRRVAIRKANVRPRKDQPKTRHTRIDRDAALLAVEAWCATETARMAADARGKSYAWLKRRLVQANVFVPSYGHRYQPGEIERAIAVYAKRSENIGRNQYAKKAEVESLI